METLTELFLLAGANSTEVMLYCMTFAAAILAIVLIKISKDHDDLVESLLCAETDRKLFQNAVMKLTERETKLNKSIYSLNKEKKEVRPVLGMFHRLLGNKTVIYNPAGAAQAKIVLNLAKKCGFKVEDDLYVEKMSRCDDLYYMINLDDKEVYSMEGCKLSQNPAFNAMKADLIKPILKNHK